MWANIAMNEPPAAQIGMIMQTLAEPEWNLSSCS